VIRKKTRFSSPAITRTLRKSLTGVWTPGVLSCVMSPLLP